MKIVFRCDASLQMGTGHVMRCLTLADALAEQGAECHFICREHTGHLLDVIQQRGHQTYSLPIEDGLQPQQEDEPELAHADWLGATQKKDAELCSNLLEALQPNWLVVDHYALDANWEKRLRPYCKKLMVVDDLADRQHDCDILLDQNYLPHYEHRYERLIPKSTRKILGPSYVLLRNEFKELRDIKKVRDLNLALPQILINFGGVGNFDLLLKIVQAVSFNKNFKYHIVTGKLKETEFLKLQQSIVNPNIKIVESSSDMANLMLESQYAIGACGSTVWERFCLGLNSALVEMADNQIPLLKYLGEKSLIDSLGNYKKLTVSFLLEFLDNLDTRDSYYTCRKSKIMKLVDGNGTQRVSDIILEVCND